MSHNITIGKLRGGFCVSWKDPASRKRRRYQLEARSRKDAEPEAVEVYRRETFRANPAGSRLDEIWQAYIEDLGDRPTATTMGYTGKAILPHFGGYLPQDINKTMCPDTGRCAKEPANRSEWFGPSLVTCTPL